MSTGEFDLKRFRTEKLKITQIQMAETLGIRQDTLSRYEDNPEDIPFKVLKLISQKFGVEFNQLFNYQRNIPQALEVKNNWTKIKYFQKSLIDYINENRDVIKENNGAQYFNDFERSLYKLTSKPKVVFLGRSDSGKSTMINAILGMDKMPTSWTPVTSIIVYIKHIEDKPEYISDDLWIFKNDKNGNVWDDSRLNDESYTKDLKIAGGAAELLGSYGTGEGENYKESKEEITSAVLFIDSPILKNCDLLDVPGFTGGKPSDVKTAEVASTKADILVYLSQANSFMGIDDAVYLKGGIENLFVLENAAMPSISKLSNLFVVATQAHIINNGDKKEIQKILNKGSERFFNTLTENFWDDRKKSSGGCTYSLEDLKKRFFSYTTDSSELREIFENELVQVVEQLPNVIIDKIISAMKTIKAQILKDVSSKIKYDKSLLTEYESLKIELERRTTSESQVIFEFKEHREDILREIENARKRAWGVFERSYYSLINETELVEVLKRRGTENRKQSKEEFLAYLSSRLDEMYKKVLVDESKTLGKKIDNYTDLCQELFNSTIDVLANSAYKSSCIDVYNTRRMLISGASGVATFGALAVWASTLGNLGGYIIVAKAVSLLASLGIHIGGTAVAIEAVSLLGGPVAWGIGLAAISALAIFSIMGGGWKKQFAKSICQEMQRRNALNDFKNANDKYWNETRVAFVAGANSIEENWKQQTIDLKHNIDNYNPAEINKRIERAEILTKIIENIPIA